MTTPTLNLELGTWNSRRSRRRAVTIIEVLFAIMVATVGVFSVIAIFPFASAQAKRARLNDMFAVAGRSAFHDVDARGMRIPDQLLAWDQGTGGFQSLNELTQVNQPDFNWATVTPINYQKNEAFCIDPRFIGASTTFASGGTLPPCCRTFPYQEPFVDADGNGIWTSGEQFTDLNGNGIHDPFQNAATLSTNPGGRSFDTSLMRRLTLRASRTGGPMTFSQANSIFRIDDDIAYARDEHDKSKPPTQDLIPLTPLIALPTTEFLKRDSERKISWMATLVPQLNVSGVQSDEYVLSVVMIYERSDGDITFKQPPQPPPYIPLQPPTAGGLAVDKFNERVVTGYCLTDGTTGGEFRLVSSDPEQLKLRANSWVMVSGVLQGYSTTGRFQWYRITECDPEPTLNSATGNYELYATLMGQDWNLSISAPAPPQYAIAGLIPVRVTIVQGAFAVYEKTIRMEADSSY